MQGWLAVAGTRAVFPHNADYKGGAGHRHSPGDGPGGTGTDLTAGRGTTKNVPW